MRAGIASHRFWKSVQPTHEVRLRRLLLYWAVVLLALVICVGLQANASMAALYRLYSSRPAPPGAQLYAWFRDSDPLVFIVAATALLWPWLTFAALMVFQISMRRAKVKPKHVLRCVIYSSDLFVSLLLLVAIPSGFEWWSEWRFPGSYWGTMQSTSFAMFWLLAASMALVTWRLWMAYKHYLRFPHPLAVVIVSQVIMILLLLKIGLDTGLIQ